MTLGNLLCGCLAIYVIAKDYNFDSSWIEFINQRQKFKPGFVVFSPWANLGIAVFLSFLALILDFLDGFVARLLKVDSEIGKQLDSLADLVSFGLLPSLLMYSMMNQFGESYITYLPSLIVLAAAYRLAKFNVNENSTGYFRGLATPSAHLFIVGLLFLFTMFLDATQDFLNINLLVFLTILISILMISNIPMFSFKMKNFGWKDNWYRYVLIIVSIPLLIWLKIGAFALIIPIYILLSLIARKSIVQLVH